MRATVEVWTILASTNGDGNSTSGGAREKLTFDSWQRLVRHDKLKAKVTLGWDTVTYAYNGLNWRVFEKREVGAAAPTVPPPDGAPPAGSTVRYQFYSPQWQQLLEVEGVIGSQLTITRQEQQLWGLRGTDDALLRRIDSDGDGSYTSTSDRGYYQLTDSSFSVIAHVDANSGQIRQRMSYDGYGNLKVLLTADFDGDGQVTFDDGTTFGWAFVASEPSADFNGDGTVNLDDQDAFAAAHGGTGGTLIPDEVRIGYGGYVRDRITGKLLARQRWYDPVIGRWVNRDPAGYVDGLDMYLYVKGNPLSLIDPMGLSPDTRFCLTDHPVPGSSGTVG